MSIILLNKQQKGVALITVLFMFALVSVVVSGMVVLNNANLSRANNYLSSEQAYLLCLSGEEIGRQLLIEDFKKEKNIDHVGEEWSKSNKTFKVDGGYFELFIVDATGKFNLNNLIASGKSNPKTKIAFSKMLNILIDDDELAETLSSQMTDWLDSDKVEGVEEFDYVSEEPPYQPPNTVVAGFSEIRWIKDMNAETYKTILDGGRSDFTVLPAQKKININTITPLTLAGLTGLDLKNASAAVDQIRSVDGGYKSVAEAVVGLPGIDNTLLDVKSEYFEIRVRSRFGDSYAYLKTIVFRDSSGEGQLEIISRDRGERFIFPFSEDYNVSPGDANYDIDI